MNINLQEEAQRLYRETSQQLDEPFTIPVNASPTTKATPFKRKEDPRQPQPSPQAQPKATPTSKPTTPPNPKKSFNWDSFISTQKVNLNSLFSQSAMTFLGSFFLLTTFRKVIFLLPHIYVIPFLFLLVASAIYLNRPKQLLYSTAFSFSYWLALIIL